MTNRVFALAALLALSSSAFAGTVSGTAKAGGPSAVVLESAAGKPVSATDKTAVMDQRGLKFVPSLLVVQTGTTVEFKNSDTVSHNIFWPNISGNKKLAHNLGTAPTGESERFKFDTPGNVPIFCNIHPEMSANIVVSPSPYFAQTDASGAFSISNVPDGEYKATAWHNGKASTVSVTVKGDTKVEIPAAAK